VSKRAPVAPHLQAFPETGERSSVRDGAFRRQPTAVSVALLGAVR